MRKIKLVLDGIYFRKEHVYLFEFAQILINHLPMLQLDNHRNQLIQVSTFPEKSLKYWSFWSEHSLSIELFIRILDIYWIFSVFDLMQLELFLSSGTLCLSVYSLVAAVFGMNIPYTWRENHEYLFKWVSYTPIKKYLAMYLVVGIVFFLWLIK